MTASNRIKAGLVVSAALVALGGFGTYSYPVQTQEQLRHDFNSICTPAAAPVFFKGLAKGMAQSFSDNDRLRSLETDEAHKQAKITDSYFVRPRNNA